MAQLIAHAGPPRLHLAWVEPAKDPELQHALRAHRLVTVHQQARGSKKDHAVVGLEPGRHVQFLIFCKPLRQFEGARIVGIHYANWGEGLSLGAVPPAARRTRRATANSAPSTKHRLPAPDNLVRFEPAPPVASAKASPARRAPQARTSPAPRQESRTTTLPDELIAAAADLRAGRTGAARRRLETVLRAIGGRS